MKNDRIISFAFSCIRISIVRVIKADYSLQLDDIRKNEIKVYVVRH